MNQILITENNRYISTNIVYHKTLKQKDIFLFYVYLLLFV